MSQTYKVVEIFKSIQGEGYWSGRRTTFIRLAGCNLSCSFCDTYFKKFIEFDSETILKKVEELGCKNICITGGEPTIQPLQDLLQIFQLDDYYISIETNGTNPINEIVPYLNWITISPKTKISEENILLASELKFVIDKSSFDYQFPIEFNSNDLVYLQPKSNEQEYVKACIELIEQYPQCRLSLQLQKIIGVR